VRAGRGNLERTLGRRLALHVAQVGPGLRRLRRQGSGRRQGHGGLARQQRGDDLGQAGGAPNVESGHLRGGAGTGHRQYQGACAAALAQGQRQGQRAAHRAQFAGQRQLAGKFAARQLASRAGSMTPAAARIPSAIGKSKRPDSLGRSAGARLTVMRLLCGKA
jgi:hypothetical protein